MIGLVEGLRVEHTNLDRKVYGIVKSMIVNRLLEPGRKIPQQKLATDLGISRTPLTNALKLLEQEHLVVAVPRRGYFVRSFGADDMIEIFEMREVLEGLAARRAATERSNEHIEKLRQFADEFDRGVEENDIKSYAETDRAFHAFVIEIGAKSMLQSILEAHNIIKSTYLIDTNEGLVRPPLATLAEHKAIIEAIIQGEPTAAESAMRFHLGNSVATIRQNAATEDTEVGEPQQAGPLK